MIRAVLLFCCRCEVGVAVLPGPRPGQCPSCALSPAKWTTLAPYKLSKLDAAFLRQIRIQP